MLKVSSCGQESGRASRVRRGSETESSEGKVWQRGRQTTMTDSDVRWKFSVTSKSMDSSQEEKRINLCGPRLNARKQSRDTPQDPQSSKRSRKKQGHSLVC